MGASPPSRPQQAVNPSEGLQTGRKAPSLSLERITPTPSPVLSSSTDMPYSPSMRSGCYSATRFCFFINASYILLVAMIECTVHEPWSDTCLNDEREMPAGPCVDWTHSSTTCSCCLHCVIAIDVVQPCGLSVRCKLNNRVVSDNEVRF